MLFLSSANPIGGITMDEAPMGKIWYELWTRTVNLFAGRIWRRPYRMDITFRVLQLRDLPAVKKPEPKLLAKRVPLDDYNVDFFGRHIVIHCRDIVVIIYPFQKLGEIQGVPVVVETHFNPDETARTRERIGFQTDYCKVSYDHSPSVIRPEAKIDYDKIFQGFRFVFDGSIIVDISSNRHHVRFFDLGIKAVFQGKIRIEGLGLPTPRPTGITRDKVDDALTAPQHTDDTSGADQVVN